MDAIDRLPSRLKLYWGSGALGVAVLSNSVSFLILAYLVDVVKIAPALAGTIILISKLFDLATDPVMGVISDRATFKGGRRRPFLFIGAFVAAFAMGILFTIPNFESDVVRAIYALAAMAVYTVGYTVFNIPYIAMSAEMTDDYEERTSLQAYRVAFVSLGSLIGGAAGPAILGFAGNDSFGYSVLAATFSAIIFASMLTCYFGTASARFTTSSESRRPLRQQLPQVLSNKPFLILLTVKGLQLTAMMGGSSIALFFVTRYLEMPLQYLGLNGLVITASSLVSIPLIIRLSKRIGKPTTYVLSASLYLLVSLSWLIEVPSPPLAEILPRYLVRSVFLGVSMGGNVLIAMSMLTDTIHYGAKDSGMRQEGVYSSFYTTVEKLSAALGPFVIALLLQLYGYDNSLPADATQTATALEGIKLGVSVFPATLCAASIVSLYFYRVDRTELDRPLSATPSDGATR